MITERGTAPVTLYQHLKGAYQAHKKSRPWIHGVLGLWGPCLSCQTMCTCAQDGAQALCHQNHLAYRFFLGCTMLICWLHSLTKQDSNTHSYSCISGPCAHKKKMGSCAPLSPPMLHAPNMNTEVVDTCVLWYTSCLGICCIQLLHFRKSLALGGHVWHL